MKPVTPLREVADILAGEEFKTLRCVLTVNFDREVEVTITVSHGETHMDERGSTLMLPELFYRLRLLQDIATMRSLAATYDIDPEKLEPLLPRRD